MGKNFIDIKDFSKEDIIEILNRAKELKHLNKPKNVNLGLLKDKNIYFLFFEPSTRTKMSFLKAASLLGATTFDFETSKSSLNKGESLIETLVNLESLGADAFIIRVKEVGFFDILKNKIKASLINAGEGTYRHPSQALLDLYTLWEEYDYDFEKLKNLKITIIGDIKNSRVARSLLKLFSLFEIKTFIYGPSTYLLENPEVYNTEILNSLEEALNISDVIILLRIQLERQNAKKYFPSLKTYNYFYGLSLEKIKNIKKNIKIMHPGPFNEGVEINSELAYSNCSLIFKQVNNGVFVRAAILEKLLKI